jgi:hypothetical protein
MSSAGVSARILALSSADHRLQHQLSQRAPDR